MPIIYDKEFGKIIIRRNQKSSQVSIKLNSKGSLSASLPTYAPIFLVKRLVNKSRDEIREILDKNKVKVNYYDGMKIGKNHHLYINYLENTPFRLIKNEQGIVITCSSEQALQNNIQQLKDAIVAILRKEAKSYLPQRTKYLAEKYNFKYNKIRLSNASSRWGSCSNLGTISLNISLMQLPFEAIDYVIIHELSHTKQMNHSKDFWNIVSLIDPNYKTHRKIVKEHRPSI